jgi:hypothetical protein
VGYCSVKIKILILENLTRWLSLLLDRDLTVLLEALTVSMSGSSCVYSVGSLDFLSELIRTLALLVS